MENVKNSTLIKIVIVCDGEALIKFQASFQNKAPDFNKGYNINNRWYNKDFNNNGISTNGDIGLFIVNNAVEITLRTEFDSWINIKQISGEGKIKYDIKQRRKLIITREKQTIKSSLNSLNKIK